jgi:hypothetical protein
MLTRWMPLLLLALAAGCDKDEDARGDHAADDADRDEDDDAVDDDDADDGDDGDDADDGDDEDDEDDGDEVAPPVRRRPDGVPVPHQPARGPGYGGGGRGGRGGGGGGGGTPDDDGGAVKPPVPGTPGAPARTGPKPIAPMPQGIVQVSDTRWTVTQDLVDRWLKSTGQVGLVRESGEGWAVTGVRTRAAYHLGMRNGDVIMEVNGHKLDTKAQLLGAYLDLKNDKAFDVVIYRNGVRRVHHYQIVD